MTVSILQSPLFFWTGKNQKQAEDLWGNIYNSAWLGGGYKRGDKKTNPDFSWKLNIVFNLDQGIHLKSIFAV